MKKGTGRFRNWLAALASFALLIVLAAGCQSGDPALQQKVTAQETRIAALEGKVGALQTAAAQAARPAATRAPTPTPLPVVSGLPVSGATKGSPTARVTITEYSDYL